ncbi:hypothetical protein AJ80_10043 [Polytolypa hystricis UAMH7299]|uniref:Uncharacterized protein n=1 Tax=Polytolypa hystricis (strain UAMH7299) TaxID=1447883 RepID=A0A2B7WET9_POLH7|nr:hypothetical protein AJ80_10043 [Polytolypa hystricis UAMH7299]
MYALEHQPPEQADSRSAHFSMSISNILNTQGPGIWEESHTSGAPTLTIVEADKILFLKDGEIVETGTHSESSEKKGQYHRMWSEYTRDFQKLAVSGAAS